MFAFKKASIGQYPNGQWGVFGRVPVTALKTNTPPTAAQAMAGRTLTDARGVVHGWETRGFDTREAAVEACVAGGVEVAN